MKHLNELELVMALDGELEPDALKQAVDHLAECGACRAQWESLQGVSARVDEYHAGLYGAARVEGNGLRVSRNVAGADAGRTPFEIRPRYWTWGIAVAAMLLISVAIGMLVRSNSQGRTAPSNIANTQTSGGTGGVAVKKNAPDVASSNRDTHPDARRVASRGSNPKSHSLKTPAAAKPDTTMAQFTELPFSDSSLPLDDAAIVRVTLPAAALRQAGVPVEDGAANTMLQADLVLGMDGLPRGIRLVQSSGANNTNGNN